MATPEELMMQTQPVPAASPQMSTSGPLPAEPVPGVTTSDALPSASPISIMDWQGQLRHGNMQAQTRQVGQNELVSHQLGQLIGSDSQYIRQAEDRARNEASSRGMMMSTMAAGAGRRAAIDAALPIASQDATTYGRTASENMAAQNADLLADQGLHGQLLGQAMGIRANLDESERARGFSARESDLGRQHQTSERLGTQSWQQNMQFMQNEWQAAQNNTQRTHELLTLERQQAHDSAMRILDQNFQGSQLDKQLLQQRFLEFENAMQNQGSMLAQVIASIYNNPNLKAADQAAAVANARAVFQSIFTSYAQSLAGGLPPIFMQPYPMPPGTAPSPVTPVTTPPVVTPPPNMGGGNGGYGGGLFIGSALYNAGHNP